MEAIITNNSIQVFENPTFGQIRTMLDENGEPWFWGKDVALVLGYKNAPDALAKHIDEEDKQTSRIAMGGQHYNVIFINESGLYSLILSSKLPQAREFKHWVTSEVLPQIRKTGGYIPLAGSSNGANGANGASDEEILSRALMIAQKTIEMKNNLLREQRPKVLFAEAVTASEDSILIRDLAKLITQNGYPIGQARLFYWLRLHGYLFQRETRPIQEWVEKGLFEVNVQVLSGNRKHLRLTTRVTGKGQQYFLDGFLSGRFRASNNDWC